jgi:hypothetical protein
MKQPERLNATRVPKFRKPGDNTMKSPQFTKLLLVVALILTFAQFAIAAVPAAPSPLSPAAGASVPAPLTISWSAVTDPAGIIAYNWQVSASSTFGVVVAQNSTMGPTQDTVSGLANGTYFWRVQAVNSSFVQGTWSQARSFSINGATAGSLAGPTLNPTKAYSTFHPREVIVFSWSPVPGAATYILQAATDPSFPVATRLQFDNIPSPSFSFAEADEGAYTARVFAVDANGVLSAPSNSISYTVSYNNPIAGPPSIISPTGNATLTLPITFKWTDVVNPQPSGYELQIAKDSSFSTIEEDDPQLNDPTRTVLSLTPGQKFWRVRSFQGDSSPTTAAVTKFSGSGSFTVSSAPATPIALGFTANPLYSGNTTWVSVQLSSAAPAGGAVINLTSSDPNAAPVPATVTMPGNIGWLQFQMQAGQVVSSTPVTITATVNGAGATGQLTVLPPSLKSISISPNAVNGGAQPVATVLLNGVAPSGGAAVNFTSSSPAVLAPAVGTAPAGSVQVGVALPTTTVTATTTAIITATWNGISVQAPLTLTPQGQPASITLSQSSIAGGTAAFVTVTTAAPATSDQIFQVNSSSPSITVPSSLLMPAGTTSARFNIQTAAVTTLTQGSISVSGGGVTLSAALTLNPPPPAAPTAVLTVTASGRSGINVTSNPAGINVPVGSTGSASLPANGPVTLSVSGGRTAFWTGACTTAGKTASCTFTLTGNASVSANVQ